MHAIYPSSSHFDLYTAGSKFIFNLTHNTIELLFTQFISFSNKLEKKNNKIKTKNK